MTRNHNERCKVCKQRIFELLRAAFGDVEGQYNLNLPSKLEDYKGKAFYDNLRIIYKSLHDYRGFKDFVKTKTLPNVDYLVHNPKIIVEFDESQHFTKPRAIVLRNYPPNLTLGFDKDKWLERCLKLNKRDNDPPRDEQRAWYDTLRDFADIPTVRLLPEEAVWCDLEASKTEDVEWFKKLILSKLPLPIEDKSTNSKQKTFSIGLAFPKLGKHDFDHFNELLYRQTNKLDLIVFPEGFETITSANRGIAPEMISEDANVKAVLKKYVSASKNYNIGVIFGFQVDYRNRLTSGGRNDQYCAFTNPQGNSYIYHKHSTSRFNAFFDSNWSIENNLRTVSLNGIGIGISVCHDSYISLISRLLAKKGADVWVNTSYQNVRPNIWESIHLTRAVENDIISLCTLHRNSGKDVSNPQKEPYAFSPKGKIRLKDIESNKHIDEFAENRRTGKIYFFDWRDHEVIPFDPPYETELSAKADKLTIVKRDNNAIGVNKYSDSINLTEITLKDYFSPEVLWKHALQHLDKTVIFIVRTEKEEWQDKEDDVLKTIKGRTIEFSTVFVFLGKSDNILLSAYRSSNYKDSRVFYPNGFPITIDSRFLKGISSTCNISLSDYRNEDDMLYYKRIKEVITKIESQ